jgi:hypothetical protein
MTAIGYFANCVRSSFGHPSGLADPLLWNDRGAGVAFGIFGGADSTSSYRLNVI